MIPERFFELDDEGKSAVQIGLELGVTKRTVQRWRRATGRSQGESPAQHPDSDRELAARLLDDGCPILEVARTVGVTSHTIRRWFPDARPWTHSEAGLYRWMLYGFEGKKAA